jgi:hypothetical protein
MRYVRCRVAVLALIALALAGCQGGSEERTIFVLLTDNRLLRVSEDGEVLSRVRLAAAPEFASYGSLLAASPHGETVYALVRGQRQRVFAFDRGGSITARITLPGEATWRRLAIGPRTGRLYLAGDAEGTRKNDLGSVELGVRLLVLSPDGAQLSLTPIREPQGRDWYAGWITLAPDESSLLVSYHGSDTTGSDVIGLDPVRACSDDTRADHAACLAHNHGRAEWVDDRILAATGEARLALLDRSGRVARELDSGLRNIHLMEFLVTDDGAYAFGDCVKGSGLAYVPLDGDSARILVRKACGDVATLLGDSRIVLGRRWSRDPYGRGVDPSLLFVHLDDRRTERTVTLPEDPAAVLAVG